MGGGAALGPGVVTLEEVLADRAAAAPDALAFAAGEERWSYGRLRAEALALAGGLEGLGVGRGDRVVLLLPAGLDFVLAFYALQVLGAVPCAFDPQAPAAIAARRAARVRPRLVLIGASRSDLERALAECGERWRVLQDVPRGGAAVARRGYAGEEDVAFLQPTSGTTGEPRAAVISQRNALASLAAARELLAAGPRDVLVGWVPPWHDLGLLRFVLGPVYFGAPCHLVPPAIRTLPRWLETAARVRATILGAPDFAYRLAARLVEPRGLDLSSLRVATNGGEAVRHSTILAFEEAFSVPGVVRPGYGLAEATLGVTGMRAGEPLRRDARGNVACGRPLRGVEVRIAADASDSPAPPGSPGEILVRGPGVFGGYLGQEAESRRVLRGGWLHTGDVGVLDADGYLYVLGRERALLKRGGAPLAPRELEEAAESVPGLRAAAAIAMPVAQGPGEELVLVVEPHPAAGVSPSDLAVSAAAAVREAVGFAPDAVLVLRPRSLPRTPNGKVRHAALRAALASGAVERGGAVLFSARRPAENR